MKIKGGEIRNRRGEPSDHSAGLTPVKGVREVRRTEEAVIQPAVQF